MRGLACSAVFVAGSVGCGPPTFIELEPPPQPGPCDLEEPLVYAEPMPYIPRPLLTYLAEVPWKASGTVTTLSGATAPMSIALQWRPSDGDRVSWSRSHGLVPLACIPSFQTGVEVESVELNGVAATFSRYGSGLNLYPHADGPTGGSLGFYVDLTDLDGTLLDASTRMTVELYVSLNGDFGPGGAPEWDVSITVDDFGDWGYPSTFDELASGTLYAD